MLYAYFIHATIEADDPTEGVNKITERLEKVLESSTAVEALSQAMRATVTLRLATDEDFEERDGDDGDDFQRDCYACGERKPGVVSTEFGLRCPECLAAEEDDLRILRDAGEIEE